MKASCFVLVLVLSEAAYFKILTLLPVEVLQVLNVICEEYDVIEVA